MHSVMNKILKESCQPEELVATPAVVELDENNVEGEREDEKGEEVVEEVMEGEREDVNGEEVVEEVAEEESDEDLVINISSHTSNESLFDFKVSEAVCPSKELKERKHPQSADEIPKKNVPKHKTEALQPAQDEVPATDSTERTTIDEFSSLLSRNDTSSMENQNKPNDQEATEKSGKNSDTWFQKSAWRDLVGDSARNLFSLSSSSQPSISSILQSQQEKKVADSIIRKALSNKEGPIITPPETKIGEEGENKQAKQEVRRVVQKVTVGEVCSFMKSAESEKEWNRTKKALSGYMKKKGGESSNGNGARKGASFPCKRFAR